MITGIDDLAVAQKLTLDQPNRLFHGFLEAAPDAVVIIDGDGVIVQVNSQTEKLFGYRREALIGHPVEVLMPERYRGSHAGQRRAFSVSPYPRSMGRGLDLFGLREDGREFPIDVSLSPLPPEPGILVASTIRDMTAQRRLEDELRQRTRELEDADRQKDQFLAAVAHELRSPLAVLANVAQLLRAPQASASVHQRAVDTLGRQTTHMARLVEDLLDLSRVRRGKVALRREAVDLRTVFSKAVEMGQPLIDIRRQQLVLAPFPGPLWVSGDTTRLVQVVSNLLTNAAKFTPEGGHIWLSAARENGAAAIRIRDDGVGIPKGMLSRVFDLFTQLQFTADGGGEGLGIGLALVRRLVELHGGTVEVISDGPGHGSEFVVRLSELPNGTDSSLSVCSKNAATP
jgi:PAS domain S-box-containing protein